MSSFLSAIRDPAFIPHGYCLSWNPLLVGLHVFSDSLIALSYFSIPVALLYFALKRRETAFNGILLLFAGFIVACGLTHVLGVYTLWQPAYWADGLVKAGTAGISVISAIALWPLIPRALALPTPMMLQQEIEERRTSETQLREANRELEAIRRRLEGEVQERRAAEAELRRTNDTLHAVNSELETFAYSVSHDLRQPVRAMSGFSQILLEDYGLKLDAEGRDYLQRVKDAGQRMGEMIEALLNLSRISRAPLHREPVDLSAMARDVLDEIRRGTPGPQPRQDIAPGLVAHADPRLLRILLQNLLANAWKFSAKVSDPTITMGREGDTGEQAFFVRDNGAGFDMTYVSKLFGVFQRLHAANEYPGTGIGLATAQRIVMRHGGRIWAHGQPGEGAVFNFTL